MAHEVEQMAYANAVPWHGLGNNIPSESTIEEWQGAAGLNWTVSKRPVQFHQPEYPGTMSTFKDKFVLARDMDNKPYSVVSDRYKPVQPKEILEFFRDLVKDFGMTIETAGALREGKRVWALAKTGDAHKVMGTDPVNSYLMLATSYDLTFSTLAQFTSVRVVCNNTLQQALGDYTGRVSIPHFRDFNAGAVKEQLGVGRSQWGAFTAAMDALSKLKLGVADASTVIHKAFDITPEPTDANRINTGHAAKIIELFSGKALGADLAGETGWGLLNAATEYFDHHKRARSQDTRLDSAWFGDSFNTKQRVLNELVEMAA